MSEMQKKNRVLESNHMVNEKEENVNVLEKM